MSAVHGTAVSRNGHAVLILGSSGAGKSALALQLLSMGAKLVADDAVEIVKSSGDVMLHSPQSTKGLIEARGIGLLKVTSVDDARLAIVVNLDNTAVGRLPEPLVTTYFGVDFPLIFGKGNSNLGAVVWCLLGGGQILPLD